MNTNRRTFAALIGAGLLWGTTVPLSKLALHWLPPGWLTFVRFAVAAAILLPAARHQLRAAFRPAVLASGALGYGGSVLLQNAGPVLATAALAAGGTLLPFALFAYAQSRVPAEVAGAFFNIEPFVGAVAGAVFFGNPVGPGQLAGGAAVLAGIGLSSLPLLAS